MHRTTLKFISFLVIMGAYILVLKFLPLKEMLDPIWGYLQPAGALGYVLFLFIGLLLSLLLLPISPVIVAGGLLFGFGKGLAMAMAILLFSTAIGYWIGTACWSAIEHYQIFRNRWFRAVSKAIKNEGAYLVGLLRMTPFIHFAIGNIFYGSLS